ncbi:hypothetical protein [Nocardiopsis aegyptia]|uniref:Uncharacterized protein n=1 Tax=Nocardiopsis aegyptia TaxID=220378 RepID=A0A7Z0EMJ3_9ACTN|nr:hypothetical protein [Nocardiopsis aegyptia]NYJ34796.1 hypothetical protein [Nocardiopsis aegyptia]
MHRRAGRRLLQRQPAGIAVFRVEFDRWIADTDERGMSEHVQEALAELRRVTAGE